MLNLIDARVTCNEALADHPTIQVGQQDGSYQVGLLGILNGLFGINDAGWGPITAHIDSTGGTLEFKRTFGWEGAQRVKIEGGESIHKLQKMIADRIGTLMKERVGQWMANFREEMLKEVVEGSGSERPAGLLVSVGAHDTNTAWQQPWQLAPGDGFHAYKLLPTVFENGQRYETTDGGKTWRKVSGPTVGPVQAAPAGEPMPLSILAPFMEKLPFVTWDRYTHGPTWVNVYGWIARDDGRSDFVLLHIYSGNSLPSFWTSSALYSTKVAELLYGSAEGHVDCKRVEDAGLEISNVVRLPKDG
jgi:hypothetical protein